jgi:uncharacterized membrane protein
MKILKINKITLFAGVLTWLGLFAALTVSSFNRFELLNIIGFSFLIIVPGFLTMLLLEIKKIEFWGYLGLVVGFSLLEIILTILFYNNILPIFHIMRPLDKIPLLAEISSLVLFLLSLNLFRKSPVKIKLDKFILFENRKDLIFAFTPVIFVVMSILGAITLNNGGNGNIILAMLLSTGAYAALLIYHSNKLGKNVIPTGLFFMSLALLFMTSLRGWFISGHDIQREYQVFQIAKNNGIWRISNFQDAYNACMSITILPTVLSNLIKVFDPYIYKVFFQIIFAIVPCVIYLTIKRFTSTTLALISTLYFIAFPTFFSDMIFLNRQEIAFVFLVLMFYIIFDKTVPVISKRNIFTVLGIGMILSHYTTTYTILALLTFLVIARPIGMIVGKYISRIKILANSGIKLSNQVKRKSSIAVWMVAILIAITFLWTTVATDTASGSIVRVITKTIETMRSNVKEDTKSGAISYSLFSFKAPDIKTLFAQYQKEVVEGTRAKFPSAYYDSSIYQSFPIKLLSDDVMPLTPIGNFINSHGIRVVSLNSIVRQGSAKMLQVLIVIGLIAVFFRKSFLRKDIDLEFILLTAGSLAFVIAQVVLPVLSAEYGVLRAFLQSMLFFGVFIVIGSMQMMVGLKNKTKITLASALVIIFFLSSTGVFTQILGGYDAQLHLNNSGSYYDSFYTSTEEVAGVKWLIKNVSPTNDTIQADKFETSKINAISSFSAIPDIYPALIQKESYIFINSTNLIENKSILSYNDTSISYAYPMQFLDANKNLIYSNGYNRIYR